MAEIRAAAVVRVEDSAEDLSLTLAGNDGGTSRLTLTDAAAETLFRALQSRLAARAAGGIESTRLPEDFSVGTGRYERLILLRFESEAPYAMAPAFAIRLARALLDQVEELSAGPHAARH